MLLVTGVQLSEAVPFENWFTLMVKAGSEALAPPLLTLIMMFE